MYVTCRAKLFLSVIKYNSDRPAAHNTNTFVTHLLPIMSIAVHVGPNLPKFCQHSAPKVLEGGPLILERHLVDYESRFPFVDAF